MSGTYLEELNLSIKILNYTGLNPLSNRTGGVRLAFTVAVFVLMLINTTVSHFVPAHVSFQDKCSISFGSADVCFVTLRAIMLLIKKKDFRVFLNELNQFWPLTNHDETVKNECKAILKLTKIATRALLYVCTFDVIVFLVLASFGKPFFFKVYEPDFVPRPVFVIWFHLFCYVGTFTAVAFDGIYVTCAMLLLIQVKLLNKKFTEYFDKPSEDKDQLKMYVDHHNFILQQIKKLGDIYGVMLLTLIGANAAMMTTSLYAVALDDDTDPNWTAKILGLLTLLATMMTFFFLYFVPSQLLSDEIVKLSKSFYLSKWYESSASKKRSLSMIPTKSQQKVVITAGKMIPMNYKMALAITNKTVFSFFTFLRTMQDKAV